MNKSTRHVLVTGANGFIGKNLVVRLKEISRYSVITFLRCDDVARLPDLIGHADAVIHLAAENRPADAAAFELVNIGLTAQICEVIQHEICTKGHYIPLIFASSTQAQQLNPYGRSKLAAEAVIKALAEKTGNSCLIFRLPGVFGKWCKPDYNSVVATYCYRIARNLPIQINDASVHLRLVHVDDVVSAMLEALEDPPHTCKKMSIEPEYFITLDELATQLQEFAAYRSTFTTQRVGGGFLRALYSTYMSYLPKEDFNYELPRHRDSRGVFVEMLKTLDSGQFSYFTAYPGMTRGGHYHHTKTEKFLVIKGEALFRFRHLLTNEVVEVRTAGDKPEIVDTIPGWSHDVTNIGSDEMIVMLWANENFDRMKPDTVTCKV